MYEFYNNYGSKLNIFNNTQWMKFKINRFCYTIYLLLLESSIQRSKQVTGNKTKSYIQIWAWTYTKYSDDGKSERFLIEIQWFSLPLESKVS